MQALVLMIAMGVTARAADLCPAAKDALSGSVPSLMSWSSQASAVGKRHCVSSGVRNLTEAAALVQWPDAGIAMAAVRDRVDMAVCCFSHESAQSGTLQFGANAREVKVTTHRELMKPDALDVDEHEYPDRIEDDARHRTISIRGTLWADGAPLVVDIALECSASRFADQFAYEFRVVTRGDDAVIEWDLLRQLEARASANVQPVQHGNTWVFLSRERPAEALATVELRTKKGTVAGRFQFDGFGVAKR